MKVVSTEALTKLIQLVKSAFIKVDDVVEVTEIETETPSEVELATVATSGSYNDLSNKPTIPTVNNATLTIQKNGTTVNTFTANASSNVTCNITVPTKVSDLTDDTATYPIDKADTLTGLTASITELNYCDGVTSSIQTQLNGKLTTADIVSSVDSTSTNSKGVGAKLFYDTCGDIETLINAL